MHSESTGPEEEEDDDDADFYPSTLRLYAAVPPKHALFASARRKQVPSGAGEWSILEFYTFSLFDNISQQSK